MYCRTEIECNIFWRDTEKWRPSGDQVETKWRPSGDHWISSGYHWIPNGYQLDTKWISTGYQMDAKLACIQYRSDRQKCRYHFTRTFTYCIQDLAVGAIISFMRASSIYHFGWWRSLLDSHNFVTSSLDIAYIFSCAATRTEVYIFFTCAHLPRWRVNPN